MEARFPLPVEGAVEEGETTAVTLLEPLMAGLSGAVLAFFFFSNASLNAFNNSGHDNASSGSHDGSSYPFHFN